ncbi:PhnD/SsuA/transferrin family substrate-binding protein [Azonexus sp.]|uniref:PhnD/SsuA/transferrin family substrate-binding protein n=1 Tax=Azonexus sp. TaxID=1872668 RepID=UPI0035B0988E
MGLLRLLATILCVLLAACDRPPETALPLNYRTTPAAEATPLYRFAVHPLHNPSKLAEAYQPLIDLLNASIPGARFELEASRDYQAYEAKFRARGPEFLLPNPWQSLQAMQLGYRVIAMAGDAEDFRGIFIVRRDSPIRLPADLKGKQVSYPSPTALAACIMPQYFLHEHGIDVNRDIENRYVGSQESAIMSAYLGDTAAAATWPPPWHLFQRDHPAEAAQLRVLWETTPLLNNSVMVRDNVPNPVVDAVRDTLLKLEDSENGRRILAAMATARFHFAEDATYQVVDAYIRRFEREVRPVEQR